MPDSAVRAVTELAAAQHSVLTRSQAAELGLSRARIATAVRQGWMTEPHRGVLRIAGSCPTWEQRVAAAVLAVDGAAASHRTAARLHDLDGFGRGTIVEVSVDRAHRWQLPAPVVTHHVSEVDEPDLVRIGGIVTTSIARTLADLGSVVRNRDLVERAVTDARRGGVSIEVVRATADRLHRPGQSGTGVLRRLLDSIPYEGVVPDSWFEEVVRRCLDDRRIPEVVPQYRIRDAAGRIVARVDLAIPSVRLAIEAHSRRHHFGPRAQRLDEERDVRLAARGWEVLYVGWHQAKSPRSVADAVAGVVAARLVA
jgi:very-short-patch-repair endonuclease